VIHATIEMTGLFGLVSDRLCCGFWNHIAQSPV
jgi:hypothetical protein